jgi:hypothetical protein
MKYFALTGLGNIESLGEHEDFDGADEEADKRDIDANWIGDEDTFKRWEEQMIGVRKEWYE